MEPTRLWGTVGTKLLAVRGFGELSDNALVEPGGLEDGCALDPKDKKEEKGQYVWCSTCPCGFQICP